MADTLESLEIEVVHSASGAADAITEVTESIRQMGKALGNVLPQLQNYASTLRNLSKIKAGTSWGEQQQQKVEMQDTGGIDSVKSAMDTTDIDAVSNAIRKVGDGVKAVGQYFLDIGKNAKAGLGDLVSTLKSIITTLKNATLAVLRFAGSLGKIAVNGVKSAVTGISNSIGKLKENAKNSLPQLKSLISSLKRVAFYRIIRSAIKEIGQAFQESLEAAYAFSQGISGESHRFAEAMDSIKASSSAMKGQLGSAFISLLAIIQPIVNAIIALITKLADAIAQLFAAFTGHTYLKAAEVPQKWATAAGGAGKAAKEWKNQLLGFDEINRLNEPNQGGGGGGSNPLAGYSLEDARIDERIKSFVDSFKAAIKAGDWETAGKLLGDKINALFPTAEQWKTWGGKLGYGLNGAIQSIYYTLKTIDFSAIGKDIASFLNGALEQIDFTYLGAVLVRKLTLALDFLLSFLGNLDWTLIGNSIFDFLMGALSEANEWMESQDWNQIGKNFFNKFHELISAIDFSALARAFFTFLGSAFGALVQLVDEFFKDVVQRIKDYFHAKFEEAGGDTWEGFKKGIKDGFSNIFDWVKLNMIDPFVNAVKSLLGIHSPSTVFASIGTNIVSGLQQGFAGAWGGFETTVSNLFGGLISWCQQAHVWIQDVLTGISLINQRANNRAQQIWDSGEIWNGMNFASGGFPDEGQLFMAREAGPELVGTMGGRTAVANNQEITEGIRQAVYDAMTASNANGNNDVSVRVYLDSREIKAGQQRLNRAWGVG